MRSKIYAYSYQRSQVKALVKCGYSMLCSWCFAMLALMSVSANHVLADSKGAGLHDLLDLCASDQASPERVEAGLTQRGWTLIDKADHGRAIDIMGDGFLLSSRLATDHKTLSTLRLSERSQIGSKINRRNSDYYFSKLFQSSGSEDLALVFWEKRREQLSCMGTTSAPDQIRSIADRLATMTSKAIREDVGPSVVVNSTTEQRPALRATLAITKPETAALFQDDPLLAIASLTILKHLKGD